MTLLKNRRWAIAIACQVAAVVGCSTGQPTAVVTPPLPEVIVAVPLVRSVTDYEEFPGRTEAVSAIDVRSRVTGYLDKVHFQEGAEVRGPESPATLAASTLGLLATAIGPGPLLAGTALFPERGQGDLLLEIDPRPYQADLARADATVIQAEARLTRLDATLKRAEKARAAGSLSPEEFDVMVGDQREALGNLGVARAGRQMALLNLTYAKIRAPISGRISRRYLDQGNLVKADDTVLTSIVSLNPIYGYFDLDERTTLRLQKLIRAGKFPWPVGTGKKASVEESPPVFMGLANEEGYPRRGWIDFSDNRMDVDTGTWRLRGVFDNAERVLSPGLFVRVRLPIGGSHEAVLVSEQAIGTDQGQKFVYVVDAVGQVQNRPVNVGRLHQGLRVINDGLAKNDQIVVSGLQRVRQGIKVSPKLIKMPEPAPVAKPADKPKA